MLKNKVTRFGLAGAAGCFVGWLVGEAFLLAFLPDEKDAAATPSLVATPEPPTLPVPAETMPPETPSLPELPQTKVADPPPPEFRERLAREKGQQFGDVRISLIWNNYNDLDLHCVDPAGEEIYFSHKKSRSGGELDVDENVSPKTDKPVENIYWPRDGAPDGTYKILVKHFKHHSARSPSRTAFKVNLLVEGRQRTFDGVISYGEPKRLIHTFDLSAKIHLATPNRIEVNQGEQNRMRIRIARERFAGAVNLRAEGGSPAVSVRSVTVPAGQTEAEMEITADSSATGGDQAIRIIATGGGARTEADLTVAVKVLPQLLALAAPKRIEVNQGGKNVMKVRIGRAARIDGPVTIRAKRVPEGVTIQEVILGSNQTEAEIEIAAPVDAPAGDQVCMLVATSGDISAESLLSLTVHEVTQPSANWSWLMVLVIGLWTSLLVIGLALALVVIQNLYLRRPWLAGSQLGFVVGGAVLVGLVSGGMGQSLLMVLAMVSILPTVGFSIGWALLGGLVGYGLAHFIPNLHRWKSSAAGALGGLSGALVFALVTTFAGDTAGRCLGAILLGLSIGLMVALVELAFRQAWLEVRYGASEVVTVNLGPEPVKVGSDSRACAIYARNAPPVALRYWLDHGKVLCEHVEQRSVSEVAANRAQEIGAVTVTVRTGTQSASGSSTSLGSGHARPITPPPPPKAKDPTSAQERPSAPVAPTRVVQQSGNDTGTSTSNFKVAPPPPPKKKT